MYVYPSDWRPAIITYVFCSATRRQLRFICYLFGAKSVVEPVYNMRNKNMRSLSFVVHASSKVCAKRLSGPTASFVMLYRYFLHALLACLYACGMLYRVHSGFYCICCGFPTCAARTYVAIWRDAHFCNRCTRSRADMRFPAHIAIQNNILSWKEALAAGAYLSGAVSE